MSDTSDLSNPVPDGSLPGDEALRQARAGRAEAEMGLQRYRLLSDQIRDIILFVRRSDGRILEANAAALQAYGYGPAEILHRTIQDLRAPETHALTPQQMARADAEGLLFETIHRRKDGSLFPVEVNSRGVEIGGERVLLSIIRDISARKASEAEQRRLFLAVEQASEIVLVTDPSGVVEYVNPAFERITGIVRTDALGKPADFLRSDEPDPAQADAAWAALKRGEAWMGLCACRRRDGGAWEAEVVVSPVQDGAGHLVNFVAVMRDVTRERRTEAQLYRAQKMEAVGRLAGGVAHEFNNILMSIQGCADLLALKRSPGSPPHEEVEEIRRGTERAASLTRRLLALSLKQVLRPRAVDLNAAVAGLTELLGRLLGADVALRLDLAADGAPIWADPGQVEQVILSLAANARDAMPEGGTLSLATADVPEAGDRTDRPAALGSGPYAALSVSDTGVGMDAGVQAHLFEPFFTTKPRGKGEGLGLATVYGVVRQSGGEITVDSAPGRGTTITVYFPRREVPDVAPAPAAPREAPDGRETVLLAEDDPGVRTVVREVLRLSGYEVLTATDGFDARKVSTAHPGPIRLLLTDVVMPGMSGPKLAAELLPLRPGMRVLYMSGYAGESAGHHGLSGKEPFLQKPFTADGLIRKIREVLGDPPPTGAR